MNASPIKYAAQVHGVDELSLHGSADAAFWRERLTPLGLTPMITDGAAQITLMAAQMRFAGVLFRELSIAIDLERKEATGDDGMFFIEAFNTVRFFAWMERVWFHTPYYFAKLEFAKAQSFRLFAGDRTALRAELAPRDFGPTEEMQRGGSVLLPHRSPNAKGPPKWFFAKLLGKTQRTPFRPSDTLQLDAASTPGVIADLVTSRFTPREWTILDAGFHGKSVTYPGPAPGFGV